MRKLAELTGDYTMSATLRVNSPGNMWTGTPVIRHGGNVLWDEEASRVPPRSAVVVVSKGDKLLGILDDSGGANLPGGGIEPGETPEEAGRRELWEETGLIATITPRVYDADGVVVLRAVDPVGKVRGSDEGQVGWVTRDEMMMGRHGKFFAKMLRRISL